MNNRLPGLTLSPKLDEVDDDGLSLIIADMEY